MDPSVRAAGSALSIGAGTRSVGGVAIVRGRLHERASIRASKPAAWDSRGVSNGRVWWSVVRNRGRPARNPEPMTAAKPKRAKQIGVSDDDYRRLLASQGGGCAICGNTAKTRRLHVDHNHRTGRVRGLICFQCNRALPTYATSAWLEKALAYVLRDEWLLNEDAIGSGE